jgi:bacterioferritin (cytochrome b1)
MPLPTISKLEVELVKDNLRRMIKYSIRQEIDPYDLLEDKMIFLEESEKQLQREIFEYLMEKYDATADTK